jgi:hypothetical protein
VAAEGRECRREDARGRAWVGPDGCRPACRARALGGGARCVRSLSAAPGARLFNVENTRVRTLRYVCRWGPETAGGWLGVAPKVLVEWRPLQ